MANEKVDAILNEYDPTADERRVLEVEARMMASFHETGTIDPDDVRELMDVMRQQAARWCAEKLGVPVEGVMPFAATSVFDRAIVTRGPAGPHVTDMALPLLLATLEVAAYEQQGRIAPNWCAGVAELLEQNIEKHWPDPATRAGPWNMTLPNGAVLAFTATERALEYLAE
jgi:hypothetical protein